MGGFSGREVVIKIYTYTVYGWKITWVSFVYINYFLIISIASGEILCTLKGIKFIYKIKNNRTPAWCGGFSTGEGKRPEKIREKRELERRDVDRYGEAAGRRSDAG
jgi:hypothetical protein